MMKLLTWRILLTYRAVNLLYLSLYLCINILIDSNMGKVREPESCNPLKKQQHLFPFNGRVIFSCIFLKESTLFYYWNILKIVIYRYISFILSHIVSSLENQKPAREKTNDNSILKYSGIAEKYVSRLRNLKLPILTAVLAVAFRA